MANNNAQLDFCDEESTYKARNYQEQLLDYALKENVIIYLPTGAGKTFIALMAMKRMSKDLEGTLAEGGKRTVFLTNTIALARQQYDVIRKFTNLRVGVYTGDMNVDNWKRDKWEYEFEKYQVIVATTQIILDTVLHKFISISQFNLMIFDECHHATKGHSMLQLMKQYFDADKRLSLPRVIGLTGLLIKSSSKETIVTELNDLEAVFCAKIVTVSNFDEFKNVLIYSTKPSEILLPYDDSKQVWHISTEVEMLMDVCLAEFHNYRIDESHMKLTKNFGGYCPINPIKKLKSLLIDFKYQLSDLGPYGGYIAILAVLIEVETKKRSADTIAYRNMIRMIINYIERIAHILKESIYDHDDPDESELDVIYSTSSHKLLCLLKYLKKTFMGKNMDDIKCLVFVQRRHTAKNIYHIIKRFVECDKTIPIVPNFMVGVNQVMPESIKAILENKNSKHVLSDFKRNECNLIVASSVLEEGIDIQSCNYVVVYDNLQGFRSYVQTKGRARMEQSVYAIQMPKSKQNALVGKIREYKDIDQLLKSYLIGKTIDRKIPLQEETEKQFEVIIKPFVTTIGAKLEATSAVQLCGRYCMSLPNDLFTQSQPKYSKADVLENNKILVKLEMPLQSTIKDDIISDPMPNVKWAKRSAAFKACVMLYENGELNDHLLPITKSKCLEKFEPVYFKHWKNYPNDNKFKAGTKKNRRLHEIQHPKELFEATPLLGIPCYLYTIYLVPEFEKNEENSHVFDSFNNRANLAILTAKKLPKIAEIPLFMSQGSVTAQISNHGIEIIITSLEDLQKLRNFNVMLFKDVLKETWSRYFAQDYRNQENSIIIVPTLSQHEIDWKLVEQFQNMSSVRKVSEIQRKRMPLNPEDFLNNTVSTWYTSDDNVKYIVTKIRNDLTPLSPFPNSEHESFASYIEEKWHEQVVQTNSFMLQVEPFTSRIDFHKYNEEKKKTRKFNSILLVPELVHNFKFPGHLYLKTRFLPSILHRLNYILIAEQLRNTLNNYLNVKCDNYIPQRLIVDRSLPRVTKANSKEIIKLPPMEPLEDMPIRTINDKKFEESQYKWRDFEEPCDLIRNMQNIYKIDIDYYHFFVNQKFQNVDLNEESDLNQFATQTAKYEYEKDTNFYGVSKKAICDISAEERFRINILNIKENDQVKGPEQCELLAAITAAGANDVFDMERVEVLGDSFLKLSVSLWLLHQHPTWNEGHLTCIKGQFVSNRNLLYLAIKKNLPGALYSKSFRPTSEWKPPLVSLPSNSVDLANQSDVSPSVFSELDLNDDEIMSGKCTHNNLLNFQNAFNNHQNYPDNESDMAFLLNKNWISDKVCADAIEAILGVCVKNYGIKKTFSVLEFFEICPKGMDMKNLLNLDLGNPRVKTNATDRDIDAFLLNYKELEKNLGYTFKDRGYLLQALTHPSFPTNRLTGCYQQLEFIGDAILDFLITAYIFEQCTDMDPGKLTDLRSALVNNVTLACLAVRNKFHLFLLSQNAKLSQSIMKFVEFQEEQHYQVNDTVRILTLENEIDNTMADYVNVPKALGDLFEALIGAIFLDSRNNLHVTWKVIYTIFEKEILEFMANVPIQVVRQLYEYHGADPKFEDPIPYEDIVMIRCNFTCRNVRNVVIGFGQNKDEAKISASKLALKHLKNA